MTVSLHGRGASRLYANDFHKIRAERSRRAGPVQVGPDLNSGALFGAPVPSSELRRREVDRLRALARAQVLGEMRQRRSAASPSTAGVIVVALFLVALATSLLEAFR